ncbi:MAG TPA: flagellar basal-body rod protein FlgG [Fimbriimonadaceae bacterium]|nr:flagellar basal-body rod protein FlgG [Fimbriimonadaceae bacterium]
MLRAMMSAGTGMVAQQINLDTIANNLANVNTTGFKGQRAEFTDLMYQTYRASGSAGAGGQSQPVAMQVGLGSQFASTATNFTNGGMQQTNNVLDLAVSGEGFFEVELADGTKAYTRDGSFKKDSEGNLVTSQGFKVTGPIQIDSRATAVTVMPDGTVNAVIPGSNDAVTQGNIRLYMFPNASGLTRLGGNLYVPGGASGDAAEVTPGTEGSGSIQSGALESSNVQVVEEMVRMITAQRAYEINSKAIQTADDMLQLLNQLKR